LLLRLYAGIGAAAGSAAQRTKTDGAGESRSPAPSDKRPMLIEILEISRGYCAAIARLLRDYSAIIPRLFRGYSGAP
jgi:hypothetical protein